MGWGLVGLVAPLPGPALPGALLAGLSPLPRPLGADCDTASAGPRGAGRGPGVPTGKERTDAGGETQYER